MSSWLDFAVWELIPELLILIGAYHLVRWSFDHRRKAISPGPWRIYVKPFHEHFSYTEYGGDYMKKSEAGVVIGLSNGKTALKIGEVLMADEEFEHKVTALQEAAETRLHIIELETTQ